MSEDALTVAAQIPAAPRPAVADKLPLAAQEQVGERLQRADATRQVVAEYEHGHELPEAPDADAAALGAPLGDPSPSSYVAIMGCVKPSPDFDTAIAELRSVIRADGRSAGGRATTTFGYATIKEML